MTLVTLVPHDWVSVSNGLETRYEHANKEGIKIISKYNIEWFLNLYDD